MIKVFETEIISDDTKKCGGCGVNIRLTRLMKD